MPNAAARLQRMTPALTAALGLWIGVASAVRAIDTDPGDYVPLPDGTDICLQYLQFSNDTGLDIAGKGDIPAHLQTDVGVFRCVHYTKLAGMTIDPQILIPFGWIDNVKTDGVRQKGAAGIGDPILASTLWLIEDPTTSTYLGVTPFITVPLGRYEPRNAVNIGNNRYAGDLQVAFLTRLGASAIPQRLIFTIATDAYAFGDNNNYLPGGSRLQQRASGQVQTWLTYKFTHASNLSVGYSATFGGKQFINGVPNGIYTKEQQVRVEVQKFVTGRVQLAVELTHDTQVIGGFHQSIGLNARILVFL